MKKYRIELVGWDFDTSKVIESNTAAKAKGQYIKEHLKSFLSGYSKNMFFYHLRCRLIND